MEKSIERRLTNKVKQVNGLCLKLTGYKGIPDRMVLVNGKCYFVELKDEGKKLRPEQQAWQDKLREMGFVAVMIDSKEKVDVFVEGVSKNGRKRNITASFVSKTCDRSD